jgi:hypothetical protein
MSYKRAWYLIETMNAHFQERLVIGTKVERRAAALSSREPAALSLNVTAAWKPKLRARQRAISNYSWLSRRRKLRLNSAHVRPTHQIVAA